jgi:ubiquinone/menaquinone biosynthesis C-methylase UbiE
VITLPAMPHDHHDHHDHARMFHHEKAHVLDDPERQAWLPAADVLARLGLRAGMTVADVGAGTGYFAIPIARAVSPGGRVLAVDLQPEMLEHLRGRLEPDLPVSLHHGEATRTTLENACADLVFYANVWHEFDDTGAALAEAERIVRPGGRVAIIDWRPDAGHPPGPPQGHRIAMTAVRAQLEERGWKVESAAPVGQFAYEIVAARATSQTT